MRAKLNELNVRFYKFLDGSDLSGHEKNVLAASWNDVQAKLLRIRARALAKEAVGNLPAILAEQVRAYIASYSMDERTEFYAILLGEVESICRNYENKSAAKIQFNYRNHLLRKRELPDNRMEHYKAFIIGNDLMINGLEQHASRYDYALVAAGGLRALWIVDKLSMQKKIIPQVFVVDNSQEVKEFWKIFKQIFSQSNSRQELLGVLAMEIHLFNHVAHAPYSAYVHGREKDLYHPQAMACEFIDSFIRTEADF